MISRVSLVQLATAVAAVLLLPGAALAQDAFGGTREVPPAQPQSPARQPAMPAPAAPAAQAHDPAEAKELQDYGVPAQDALHAGQMHGPTPTRIPGGTVITTGALRTLLQDRGSQALLFDVLGAEEMLPNALQAVWTSQSGSYNDQVQQQFVQALNAQLRGQTNTPLVFYCASTQCWMSYNAALRAIRAGYTQVFWYRGGLEAWKAAGMPTQPAQRR